MEAPLLPGIDQTPPLSERDLSAIIQLVYEKSGITLHAGKRELVTARLQKRVKAGGFKSFSQYLKHVHGDATGEELTALLDAMATNHTHFFREPQHFTFLTGPVLAEMAEKARTTGLDGWSAACSTGEEPYTILMSLLEAGCSRVRLLASDISTKALATARGGVYRMERVGDVPQPLLRAYFEKGLGAQAGLARVQARVRSLVEFRQMNLLEIASLDRRFDFIFCRNVMIYFDKAVQQRVITMLERHLEPGGYLFIAHSESLNGLRHGLQPVVPAVFRRPRA
ncbi:MAG: protein-glutamate O-methyltransferase CheR [Acidobacteria bacterium]|nr:protein-glutamate O-methyltransferase CheR [Acidobacteriota bacterium]